MPIWFQAPGLVKTGMLPSSASGSSGETVSRPHECGVEQIRNVHWLCMRKRTGDMKRKDRNNQEGSGRSLDRAIKECGWNKDRKKRESTSEICIRANSQHESKERRCGIHVKWQGTRHAAADRSL